MAREKITAQEMSTVTGQERTGGGSDMTSDEAKNAEEKGDEQAQKSPDPLRTRNKQQQIALLDPPSDRDPPSASYFLNLSLQTQTGAYTTLSSQLTMQRQSPPSLTSPDRQEIAHLAWFQSPQKICNPYTGCMVQAPTPPCLQAMIQELQNHEHWFEAPDDINTQQAPALDQVDDPTAIIMEAKQPAGRNSSP